MLEPAEDHESESEEEFFAEKIVDCSTDADDEGRHLEGQRWCFLRLALVAR